MEEWKPTKEQAQHFYKHCMEFPHHLSVWIKITDKAGEAVGKIEEKWDQIGDVDGHESGMGEAAIFADFRSKADVEKAKSVAITILERYGIKGDFNANYASPEECDKRYPERHGQKLPQKETRVSTQVQTNSHTFNGRARPDRHDPGAPLTNHFCTCRKMEENELCRNVSTLFMTAIRNAPSIPGSGQGKYPAQESIAVSCAG